MTEVRVRFAPSPTGVLHLGGARTALFNWLYARHVNGKFLLRIEDTDKARSTKESKDAILNALSWLGLNWDEEIVLQSDRIKEHKDALNKLIKQNAVYKCYCTAEERRQMREEAIREKRPAIYDRRCDGKAVRDDIPFVWRFKMDTKGQTVLDDLVQGKVVTNNEELEDIVIARSDGSPLYNFVVVLDDAFMGITHVIRGKDHLTNTAKQIQIYKALGFSVPKFGHLPLILGLSKRLRSAGIESYRNMGYLPQAVNNYISRLGWSHGDQEIFTMEELVGKFRIDDVMRAEGKLDMDKMLWTNAKHIQMEKPEELARQVISFMQIDDEQLTKYQSRIAPACETLKARSKTLLELAEKIKFYLVDDDKIVFDPKAAQKFLNDELRVYLKEISKALGALEDWNGEAAHDKVKSFCEEKSIPLKKVAQPIRVALTGKKDGPGLFEMMEVLGQKSTCIRLENC